MEEIVESVEIVHQTVQINSIESKKISHTTGSELIENVARRMSSPEQSYKIENLDKVIINIDSTQETKKLRDGNLPIKAYLKNEPQTQSNQTNNSKKTSQHEISKKSSTKGSKQQIDKVGKRSQKK